MPTVHWPNGTRPRIGEWVSWVYRGLVLTGQVAEIHEETETVVIDADDRNRWHLLAETAEPVRRFPIPLQP